MGILHENSDVSLKTESFHDANFIVTGTTCCLTTPVATIDDKVGIMTIFAFQCFLHRSYRLRYRPHIGFVNQHESWKHKHGESIF